MAHNLAGGFDSRWISRWLGYQCVAHSMASTRIHQFMAGELCHQSSARAVLALPILRQTRIEEQ
jgi:hypothetical protein